MCTSATPSAYTWKWAWLLNGENPSDNRLEIPLLDSASEKGWSCYATKHKMEEDQSEIEGFTAASPGKTSSNTDRRIIRGTKGESYSVTVTH